MMNYKGKHGLTAGQVVAIAIIGIVAIIVLTTAASARMMGTDPAEDFAWAMTHEIEPT